jgi:hypothetical protein
MEVEAKPSPWPCVVMLVGLLLCCLAMPRFWRSAGTPDPGLAPPEQSALDHGPDSARINQLAEEMLRTITGGTPSVTGRFGNANLGAPFLEPANSSIIASSQPPTIDELINTSRLRGNLGSSEGLLIPSRPEFPTLSPPLAPPNESWPWVEPHVTVVSDGPNPHILAALEGIGQALSAYCGRFATRFCFTRGQAPHGSVR